MDCKLYKKIGSIIIGDTSAATEKEDIIGLWHMRLRHMSDEVFKSYTK